MAARITKGTKDVPWDERTRAKIKTSMLVNRLSDHALNGNSMSATQIRAAEILLNKTLANLTATELVGSVATYVARLPTPAPTAAAWLESIDTPDQPLLPATCVQHEDKEQGNTST
jgi:hypothetical protein